MHPYCYKAIYYNSLIIPLRKNESHGVSIDSILNYYLVMILIVQRNNPLVSMTPPPPPLYRPSGSFGGNGPVEQLPNSCCCSLATERAVV